jgi:hypothetical protein
MEAAVSALVDELRARLSPVLAPDAVDAVVGVVDELERRVEVLEGRGTSKELLTYEEAAERLSITYDAARMRAKSGRYETVRHGRNVYIVAASIYAKE